MKSARVEPNANLQLFFKWRALSLRSCVMISDVSATETKIKAMSQSDKFYKYVNATALILKGIRVYSGVILRDHNPGTMI